MTLLNRAADILCEHRTASVSLLQRHLGVGYGEAMLLLAQLASIGFVEAPNPKGRYRLAPLAKVGLLNQPQERHARALRDLALYLIECRGGLDTRAVAALLHPLACPMDALKEVAEHPASASGEPVLGLARLLATLPPLVPPADAAPGFDATLEDACKGHLPLPHHLEGSVPDRLRNSLVRAVRYLYKRLHDGFDPDTRALEYFVHDSLLPQGRGLEGKPTYREHVVPCALLCTEATRMLEYGAPSGEVAEWLEPWLRVVWIDPALARKLDVDRGLKTTMPPGWLFGRGCMYQRLHEEDILFVPPPEGPECACGRRIDRRG